MAQAAGVVDAVIGVWRPYVRYAKRRGVRVLRLGVWRRRNDRFVSEYRFLQIEWWL